MYISINTADRIKKQAKTQGISIKDVLEKCALNKNTLSTMISRGSWIQANNLAKIADVLDCSVDYLLGRTDIPEVNRGVFTIQNDDDISNTQIAAYSGKSSQVSRTVDEEMGFLKKIITDEDE